MLNQQPIKLDLHDEEWEYKGVTHDREIVRAIVFDDEGYCLSQQNGVWDNKQKICRYDCIKWDKERGCVKEEQLRDNEKNGIKRKRSLLSL
jgi:hypothetical protein